MEVLRASATGISLGQPGLDQRFTKVLALVEPNDPGAELFTLGLERADIELCAPRQLAFQPGGRRGAIRWFDLDAGQVDLVRAIAIAHLELGGSTHLEELGGGDLNRSQQQQADQKGQAQQHPRQVFKGGEPWLDAAGRGAADQGLPGIPGRAAAIFRYNPAG